MCLTFYREAESGFRGECAAHTRILFAGSRPGFAQQQLLQFLQTNSHHASSTRQVHNGSHLQRVKRCKGNCLVQAVLFSTELFNTDANDKIFIRRK